MGIGTASGATCRMTKSACSRSIFPPARLRYCGWRTSDGRVSSDSIMTKIFRAMLCLLLTIVPLATRADDAKLSADQIKDLMRRAMEFQIQAYGAKPPVNWQSSAFWSGVMACYDATKDRVFLEATKTWGKKV